MPRTSTQLSRLALLLGLALGSAACCNVDRIFNSQLPDGTVGRFYSEDLETNCDRNEALWTVTAGTLPPGLSVSDEGHIEGTPTLAGAYVFTVQAESRHGSSGVISKGFAISIAPRG
jgi:hypothetical protein